MNPCTRPPDAATRCALPLVVLLLTLWLTNTSDAAGPGVWTPKAAWSDTARGKVAIHMALLRGDDDPYHSRVMWFGSEQHDVFKGGIWGWKPDAGDCSTFPTTSFDSLPSPLAGHNVFCSGHSGLADGRFLVAGGDDDEINAYGDDESAIYEPGADYEPGTWTPAGQMNFRRWYPTSTTLKDGRVLVTAGFQHRQHRIFGGRLDDNPPESPSGDIVRRWAPVPGGAWDPEQVPAEDSNAPLGLRRPEPCEGHSGTELEATVNPRGQVLLFGGRRDDGSTLNQLWTLRRQNNPTGSDYQLEWERKSPTGDLPVPARSEHSAVLGNGKVYFFGGRDDDGLARREVFAYTPGSPGFWANLTPSPDASTPTPRLGHVAIYDESWLKKEGVVPFQVRRMIVFGGVPHDDSLPKDRRVYELRFNDPSPGLVKWHVMTETTVVFRAKFGEPDSAWAPGPLYWHRATPVTKGLNLSGHIGSRAAFMYGGVRSTGEHSDSLWALMLFETGKYGWVWRRVAGEEQPGPRARFSLAYDPQQGQSDGPRLYVHGGRTETGLADAGIYVIDPDVYGDDWQKWGDAEVQAEGHVSVREHEPTHSRVGEIYDPAAGTWTSLPDAPLLQHSYPVTFTVSSGSGGGGRVISASSVDGVTRYADLPGPGSSSMTWQAFSGTAHGIPVVQTGVLYRPNKLMLAGGGNSGSATGVTRRLDALASAGWQSSDTMLARSDHNLVLLPDGNVLATGGIAQSPVQEPQIWNPDLASGAGVWTDPGTLAASTAVRGYHSTSILLPDGRVLCAGGDSHGDMFLADIYCPPYLFNADGSLANRPVLSSAPSSLSYGERFMLCVATDTATVAKVALVRPGMTTHTFDQNQRYVPLTFSLAQTVSGTERRFVAEVPADSSIVPPGDYLLFIVNGAGTPSIARWVRVRGTNGDTDPPTTVQDLAVVQDSYSSTDQGVTIDWTPPYGDQSGSCRGPAERYRIRYRYSSMPTWNDFEVNGTPVTNPPVPGLATGPKDTVRLTGLPDGVQVHVRLVSKDFAHNEGNWSALSSELAFWVNPGGGEGGGGEGEIIPPLRSAEVAAVATLEGSVAPTGFLENTLFPGGLAAEPRMDRLLLHNGPRMQDGRAQVRVSQPGSTTLELQALRLVAVDHASDLALDAGDGRLLGSFEAAAVVERNGVGVAAALEASGPLTLSPREPLVVRFDEVGGSAIMLLASRTGEDMGPLRGGVHVEVRGSEGWVPIGHVLPRRLATQMLLRVPQAREYRLTAGESVVVHAVGRLVAGTGSATETVLDPVALAHSNAGPLAPSSTDGVRVASGESLVAEFVPPPLASGLTRTWFLEVTASRAASTAQISADAVVKADLAPTPERLLLRAPVPNPSNAAAHVGFDLPRATHAVVEVFDLLGRRLAVLAERSFAAGSHSVLWDGRLPSGSSAPPGVYSVRLRADGVVHRVRLVRMR